MSKGFLNLTITLDEGYPSSYVGPISACFWRKKKPEWFDDEFVKRVIKGIDKAEVIFQEALKDRNGRGIPSDAISSTSKSVILMYFHPEYYYLNSMFGKNAWPYICELIDSGSTINIQIDADFHPSRDLSGDIPIVLNGRMIEDYEEYEDAFADYKDALIEHSAERERKWWEEHVRDKVTQ